MSETINRPNMHNLYSLHSVVVNSGAIGANLASCHDGEGCFVSSITTDVSCLQIGDMLKFISKNVKGDRLEGTVDLACMPLPEIQSQIQAMIPPYRLTLQRRTNLELINYFQFLQCPIRGPQFLDDCDDIDSVDQFLSLCHVASVDEAILDKVDVIEEVLRNHAFVQEIGNTVSSEVNVDTSLVVQPVGRTSSFISVASRVEKMVQCYVTSAVGAARLAYWKTLTYPCLSLADILADVAMIKALYFFAQQYGYQEAFFGLRLGTKDQEEDLKLSSTQILRLAEIVPNTSLLRKFSNRKIQLARSEHISVHGLPFEIEETPDDVENINLIIFEDMMNIKNIFIKNRHGDVVVGTENDIPPKLLAFAMDLVSLMHPEESNDVKKYKAQNNLIAFRHGIYSGIVACNDERKILLFATASISLIKLRKILVSDETQQNINSELAIIIKFNAAIDLKINSEIIDHTAANIVKELFTARSLTILFIACLLEARIVIISDNYFSANTFIANFLLELIEPFKWQHIVEPIIPDKNLCEILAMPFPYICGTRMNYLPEQLLLDELFIFEIDRGSVKAPNNFLNILRTGTGLAYDLEKLFKPFCANIDSFYGHANNCFLNLSAIVSLCNNWVKSKLTFVSACTTVIGNEVFLDEKEFTSKPFRIDDRDDALSENQKSEQEFLLALSRTQHFSVYLADKFL